MRSRNNNNNNNNGLCTIGYLGVDGNTIPHLPRTVYAYMHIARRAWRGPIPTTCMASAEPN